MSDGWVRPPAGAGEGDPQGLGQGPAAKDPYRGGPGRSGGAEAGARVDLLARCQSTRVYRGMHHLSDVIIGAINGLICAALAAYCLLRPGTDPRRTSADQNVGVTLRASDVCVRTAGTGGLAPGRTG